MKMTIEELAEVAYIIATRPTLSRDVAIAEIARRFETFTTKANMDAAVGDGTAENPFIATYNSKFFRRHDSDLIVSICERDDAFELLVIPPRTGPTRYYRIEADGAWTDLASEIGERE